jgi:GNAT superfamily N-acetyltransferase
VNDAPQQVLAHWAAELGCPAEYFARPGTFLVRSAALALNRFQLLRTGASAVLRVSSILEDTRAPTALFGETGQLAPASLSAEQLIERLQALSLTMAWTDAIYCAADGWLVPEDVQARQHHSDVLRGRNAAALRALVSEAGEREAFLSGIAEVEPPLYGSFAGKTLCAVAGCIGRQQPVVGVRVLVDPRHRRQGHGAAVVAALNSAQLALGKVTLLASSVANRGGVGLARTLDMQQVAIEEGMELLGG